MSARCERQERKRNSRIVNIGMKDQLNSLQQIVPNRMGNETDASKQWKNILDRDTLKGSINIVALFITVYELLENTIISKPKDFYTVLEFDERAQITYKDKVLSLYDKNVFPSISTKNKELIASLVWFKKNGAIDDNDIEVFTNSRTLRNKITHEMLYVIADGGGQLEVPFALMYALFCKIEKWWILEVEIPTGGELSPDEIDQDGVMSGHMLVLDTIMDILANNSNIHFREVCGQLGIPVK